MIEEQFTDAERQRLLKLALVGLPDDRRDDQLTNIIVKLAGADTVLVARRGAKWRRDDLHSETG